MDGSPILLVPLSECWTPRYLVLLNISIDELLIIHLLSLLHSKTFLRIIMEAKENKFQKNWLFRTKDAVVMLTKLRSSCNLSTL